MKDEEGKSFRKKGTVDHIKCHRCASKMREGMVSTEHGNLVATCPHSKRQWGG